MYTLIQDDDCHWYVIPVDKIEEAHQYFDDCENYQDVEYPQWLDRVGGSLKLVEFPEYTIK